MSDWVSRRTRLVALVGVLAVMLVYVTTLLLADPAKTVVSDLGEFAIVLAAAVVVFRTVARLTPGEPLRTRWMLVAAGVGLFAAGDAVWSVLEVFLGQNPFPSSADPFYLAVYPVLGAGLISAALAFRQFANVRRIVLVTTAITLALAAALYVGFLHAVITDTETTGLARALSVAYPLGDIFLLFAPALFAALSVRSLGTGRLAVPWWGVTLGVALLAVTDAAFGWLDFQGLYSSGNIIDIGWMLGYLSIAVGASLTRDLL